MAISVRLNGLFRIFNSSTSKNENEEPLEEETTITEKTSYTYKIAASQTDVSLPFAGVASAKKVFLKPDQEITLKVNDSGEAGFPVDSLTILGGTITALYVSTGGSETELKVILGG